MYVSLLHRARERTDDVFWVDHGEEATKYLKEFIGEHYAWSDEPVFQSLWRNYNECQFVEDDGTLLFCVVSPSVYTHA